MLINTRLLTILILGFSSGLPLALTNSTLQAWFTEAHVNLITIGALSFIGLPYVLKFLWAPIMDHYNVLKFGKRKGWILCGQLGVIITLIGLAYLDPVSQAGKMGAFALLVAFFSASQDISITAYQTDILLPVERGLGVAYYVFAWRIAALISGGLALMMADYVGFKVTYQLMALLMLVATLCTYYAPEPTEVLRKEKNLLQTSIASLKSLLNQQKIIPIFLFIIFYKFGDALALQLMTPFLLHQLHFTLTEVGFAYKIMSIIATIAGTFVGGLILTRLNIFRALILFGLAQAFSNLMFVVLALVGKQFYMMMLAIFTENFCTGMSTAALVSFMMSLCHREYTASQFALLSAIASLSRVLLGPLAAFLVNRSGWVQFYFLSFLLSFPGLFFLMFLKNRVLQHAQALAD